MVGLLILSGGQGRRMDGQDKGWVNYNGYPMVEQLIGNLQSQIKKLPEDSMQIVISANRYINRYQALGFQVVTDSRADFQGPLSGLESALEADEFEHIKRWIVCPVDTPILPADYLQSMLKLDADQLGYLCNHGRHHYAHLSVPVQFKNSLFEYLENGGRSIKGWLFQQADRQAQAVMVELNDIEVVNINHLTLL